MSLRDTRWAKVTTFARSPMVYSRCIRHHVSGSRTVKTWNRWLAIALATLSAASAHAGSSRIGNSYYEDIFAPVTCTSTQTCTAFASSATPADAFLRIQHVYCLITLPANTSLARLTLGISGGGNLIKKVNVGFPPAATNGPTYYNIDHDFLLATGGGRTIGITAEPLGGVPSMTMECAITGDLIPPPQ
jgi:hypothetical protein